MYSFCYSNNTRVCKDTNNTSDFCPKCGANLVWRHSEKYGDFLSCFDWKKCKWTSSKSKPAPECFSFLLGQDNPPKSQECQELQIWDSDD